jgi:phosphoribosylamine--glycine ligase
MGAYSPAPPFTAAIEAEVMARIIRPTLAEMAARGTPFHGVLFAGLMLTATGPRLIEYNVRFGDPECQVLMLRLESDLLPMLRDAATGRLPEAPRWRDAPALLVVLTTQGYPGAYRNGTAIRGLERAAEVSGVTLFHAGTRLVDGVLQAHGGRVLGVGAVAPDIAAARDAAYAAIARIDWPEAAFRRDIAWRALPG